MTIREYLDLLWRHRLVFLGTSLLAMAVTALVVTLAPPAYSATAHLYFVARGSNDFSDFASGQDLAVRMMPTYSNLATSDIVLDPVAQRFGTDNQTLKAHLGISVPAATSDMFLTVNDGNAERAADLANAVAAQLSSAMGSFSTSLPSGARSIVAERVGAALPPPAKQPLRSPLVLAGLVVLGLLVGSAATALRHLTHRRVRSTEDIPAGSGRLAVEGLEGSPGRPLSREFDRRSPAAAADYADWVRAIRNVLSAGETPPRRVLIVSDGESSAGSRFVDDLAQAYSRAQYRTLVVSTAMVRTRHRAARLRVPTPSGGQDFDDSRRTAMPTFRTLTLSDILDQPLDSSERPVEMHSGGSAAVMHIEAGSSTVALADLLARPQWSQLLHAAAKQFDVVLVHAPSAADRPELASVAVGCDAALVTADGGRSQRASITRAVRALVAAGLPTVSLLLDAEHRGRAVRVEA
jgi:capsular polysaccharide biosynthesis protein/Mrp family chromosome partitioning ATPase